MRPRAYSCLVSGSDQPLLLQLVDVADIGGRKHVHRRALLDLLRQLAGGAEVEDDLVPRLCLELLADLPEGIGQIGGRRHGERDRLLRGREGLTACQEQTAETP